MCNYTQHHYFSSIGLGLGLGLGIEQRWKRVMLKSVMVSGRATKHFPTYLVLPHVTCSPTYKNSPCPPPVQFTPPTLHYSQQGNVPAYSNSLLYISALIPYEICEESIYVVAKAILCYLKLTFNRNVHIIIASEAKFLVCSMARIFYIP